MTAGTLYVVATPIGNLSDVGARALEVLGRVELIACEDTRTSRHLLAHYGIAARTVALHDHNERAMGARLIETLKEGRDVALISDAGTPAVSDPGARLVEAAHREGLSVVAIPGPSAALAAWSAAGFAADRFVFAGFLPSSPTARKKALAAHVGPDPVIFYEAPHRVLETVADLLERCGPERELVIARELTKKFEEVARVRLADAPAWLRSGPHRQQGEFVLVLGPGVDERAPGLDEAEKEAENIVRILLTALPPSDAARLGARITRKPRKELYSLALALARKANDAK